MNDPVKVAALVKKIIDLNPDMAQKAIEKTNLQAWFVGRTYHSGRVGLPRSTVEEIVAYQLAVWEPVA